MYMIFFKLLLDRCFLLLNAKYIIRIFTYALFFYFVCVFLYV